MSIRYGFFILDDGTRLSLAVLESDAGFYIGAWLDRFYSQEWLCCINRANRSYKLQSEAKKCQRIKSQSTKKRIGQLIMRH